MIRKFAIHSSWEKPTVDQSETLPVNSARKCDCLFHRSSLPGESDENVEGEKHYLRYHVASVTNGTGFNQI